MFLPFVLRLIAGSVFPLFLLSLLSTPFFGVEPLTVPRLTNKERPLALALAYSLLFTRTAIQFYVWCGGGLRIAPPLCCVTQTIPWCITRWPTSRRRFSR